jgi:hypothetical protein
MLAASETLHGTAVGRDIASQEWRQQTIRGEQRPRDQEYRDHGLALVRIRRKRS